MNDLSDEKLVELFLAGDKQALNIIIKRYLTPIFNYALSYVREPAVADDMAQEVFVKVWKKLKKFDNKYKFKNWIYTIAKNTCLDYLKKNRAVNFSALDREGDDLQFENLIGDAAASPEAGLISAGDAAGVNTAVEQLPEKYKETIKLHYHGGYKFREIAAILKQSIETVKSRNRRALLKLRKMIGK